MTPDEHRLSWVAALAKLTTPHDAERAAAAMSAYLPFLAELPMEAFTLASMRHVAMQDRRMMIPDLREVLAPLQAWWRDNGPQRVALPSRREPERQDGDMTPEQRAEAIRVLRGMTGRLTAEPGSNVTPIRANHLASDALAKARAELAAKARA